MKFFLVLLVFLSMFCPVPFCEAENIILSAATADKKLILMNIEYSNKTYGIVDQAIFNVPFEVGNTALGRLQNGNYQVVWTAQEASNKIKLNSMVFDVGLNKVGNIKKFGPVLYSHFNLNIVESNEATLNRSNIDQGTSNYSFSGLPEFVFVTGRNEITGAPVSIRKKLFSQPPVGFRPENTRFTCPSDKCYYSAVGSTGQTRRGALFGSLDNNNYTSAFIFTKNIQSGCLLPVSGTENYNFVHTEYGNNRFRFMNRQFNGPSGQPAGNLKTTTSFFNWTASYFPGLVNFGSCAAVPSKTDPRGGHVFFISQHPDGVNTQISAFHMDTQTGNRNSLVRTVDNNIVTALFYALNGIPNP